MKYRILAHADKVQGEYSIVYIPQFSDVVPGDGLELIESWHNYTDVNGDFKPFATLYAAIDFLTYKGIVNEVAGLVKDWAIYVLEA